MKYEGKETHKQNRLATNGRIKEGGSQGKEKGREGEEIYIRRMMKVINKQINQNRKKGEKGNS